jgi:iron(II)-dependent oxidoreductase
VPTREANTLPLGGAESLLKERLQSALWNARADTLALVDPVAERDLDRVHDPLMSPLLWDLGHIAAYEDLWLAQRAGGLKPLRPDLAVAYDAAETPRADRGNLPYLRRDDALAFMAEVRERALAVLGRTDLDDAADPLNKDGYVWEMLALHEAQHNETMLQTLQIATAGTYSPSRTTPPTLATVGANESVLVPGGRFRFGAAGTRFAFDNELPAGEVDVPAFQVDRTPVTCGAYNAWIEDGGYERREWWSDTGWAWREAEAVARPLYWTEDGRVRSFDRVDQIEPAAPVMNVSWFEADAFARAHGKRLPTEIEWEKAASWDHERSQKLAWPWGADPPGSGHANLGVESFGPWRAGSLPAGAAPCGALGMIGDIWEWTATEFYGYPGFRAFPYPEYSEVFFDHGYRVLRGGSWATRHSVASNTFRNWDHPQRRQIFSGFRCAEDA